MNASASAPASAWEWKRLVRWAEEEVTRTMAELPEPLREAATALPVCYERIPGALLVADGIEPDTLGLFVGPDYCNETQSHGDMPPQILLFLMNLWEMAESREEVYRAEVRTTYMHELGHYLGLDEDDLDERGLT